VTRQAGGRVLVVVHDEDAATVIDCSRPLAIATTRIHYSSTMRETMAGSGAFHSAFGWMPANCDAG
jgi:hypothetical protein